MTRSTFVAPYDADNERLTPPAQQVTVQPPDTVDVADVLAAQNVRVVETRDAMTAARAFLLKYAGLTLVLVVLAAGLTVELQLGAWRGVLVFAALAIGGYAALSYLEHEYTTVGVEKTRLRHGARVLREQLRCDTEVRLAQVTLQRESVAAQRAYNEQVAANARQRASSQLQRHEAAQSHANRLHTHVPYTPLTLGKPPDAPSAWNVADLPAPTFLRRRDEARRVLLDFVTSLYDRDEDGALVRLHDDGRVRREVRIPFGSRGGLTPSVRQQCQDVLRTLSRSGAWLLRYDEDQRLWRLNVATYRTVDDAIDALDAVPTVAA